MSTTLIHKERQGIHILINKWIVGLPTSTWWLAISCYYNRFPDTKDQVTWRKWLLGCMVLYTIEALSLPKFHLSGSTPQTCRYFPVRSWQSSTGLRLELPSWKYLSSFTFSNAAPKIRKSTRLVWVRTWKSIAGWRIRKTLFMSRSFLHSQNGDFGSKWGVSIIWGLVYML